MIVEVEWSVGGRAAKSQPGGVGVGRMGVEFEDVMVVVVGEEGRGRQRHTEREALISFAGSTNLWTRGW